MDKLIFDKKNIKVWVGLRESCAMYVKFTNYKLKICRVTQRFIITFEFNDNVFRCTLIWPDLHI